jgi:Uma2 family endonuclease
VGDITVAEWGSYWTDHPSHAFLLVEVARSSLPKDRGLKMGLYAGAIVDEYWIVNHVDETVEVYRDSLRGEWQTRTIHQRGDTIAMVRFPDVTIRVSDILPPRGLKPTRRRAATRAPAAPRRRRGRSRRRSS